MLLSALVYYAVYRVYVYYFQKNAVFNLFLHRNREKEENKKKEYLLLNLFPSLCTLLLQISVTRIGWVGDFKPNWEENLSNKITVSCFFEKNKVLSTASEEESRFTNLICGTEYFHAVKGKIRLCCRLPDFAFYNCSLHCLIKAIGMDLWLLPASSNMTTVLPLLMPRDDT